MDSDPVWAYCGQRAIDRKTTKGVTRHALTAWARLSGAMDAECGVIGLVPAGPWQPEAWDPAEAPACPRCVAYLAGLVPIPEEVAEAAAFAAAIDDAAAQLAAQLAAPAPTRQSSTPSLFEAA